MNELIAIIDWPPLAILSQMTAGPDWLATISRVAHVLAGIVFLGGVIFWSWVLLPGTETWSKDESAKLFQSLRQPWALVVMASSFVLLVSGFYNYVRVIMLDSGGTTELPKAYHPLIGTKILLALFLFCVVALLAGRSAAAQKMQARMSLWLKVAVLVGLVLVSIAGVLRMLDRSPSIGDDVPGAVAETSDNPET
ncbi:MAG: hypothetical protein WDZ59_09610 [Pirellulales bacterium]